MLRVQAVTFTLLALLALGVTAVLAKNPLDAIVGSIIGAILWAAGMHFLMARKAYNLPPVRTSPEGLPPRASVWKRVIPGAAFLAVFYAADVAYSLYSHEYFVLGIALGCPIFLWDNLHMTRRTQREEHGVLWSTGGWLTWRTEDRIRYVSVDDHHYAANLDYGNEAGW
jgi:hypothetical protein